MKEVEQQGHSILLHEYRIFYLIIAQSKNSQNIVRTQSAFGFIVRWSGRLRMTSTPTSSVKLINTTATSSKRLLAETSPEERVMDENVGSLTMGVLMEHMQGLLNKTLQPIEAKLQTLPTKQDLEELANEVSSLKLEVNSLKNENCILREQIELLRVEKEVDRKELNKIGDQIRRKNLIIKGVEADSAPLEAVEQIFKEMLKIATPIEVCSARRIGMFDDKATLLVELSTEAMVFQVLKTTKLLAGSDISINRDLSLIQQQQQKVMVQLKKDLTKANKKLRILARDGKLKVEKKWLSWNRDFKLVCDKEPAEAFLKEIYGEAIEKISLDYEEILEKAFSKN